MRHVVSAEQYFESLSTNTALTVTLNQYFSNIPSFLFEGLDNIDPSSSKLSYRRAFEHTADEIIDHQIFLLEKLSVIPNIIQREDLLVRAGYDTIALRLNESYLETLELVNENVLTSVMNFLKSTVDDPDPTQKTLNIIRLVSDLIGIVPFKWAGIPIDIVSNVLSALISLYKEEYFAMSLSLLAAIDVTHATAFTKTALKPISKLLEPVLKILCRNGASTIAVEKAVLELKDGIIRIGGDSLLDTAIQYFKSIGEFMATTVISVIKQIAGFIDAVLNIVTVGTAKEIGKFKNLVDKIIPRISATAKNFDTAANLLKQKGVTVKAGDTVLTSKGKEVLATSKLGKKTIVADLRTAATETPDYLNKLTNAVSTDPKFNKTLANLTPDEKAVAIAAKVENELIGQNFEVVKRIIKDPDVAKHLADTYGWVPGKNFLEKLARSGDVDGVKKFFDVFISDPAVSKNLSKNEIKALSPFKTRPDAFIAGVKNFDNTVKTLEKAIAGGAKGAIKLRALQFRRLLLFIARLYWQKYGSLDCIIKAGVNQLDSDILNTTLSLATASPNKVNEDDSVSSPTADAIAKSSKADCGKVATAAMATVGHVAQAANFPGSTANLGGTMNMGDDPKKSAEFQENSAEYSKDILKALGLAADLDVQHALEYNDPATQVYYADVIKDGHIEINQEGTPAEREAFLNELIKRGTVKPEQANEIRQKVQGYIDSGEAPELELPPAKTNESLFRTKGVSGLINN